MIPVIEKLSWFTMSSLRVLMKKEKNNFSIVYFPAAQKLDFSYITCCSNMRGSGIHSLCSSQATSSGTTVGPSTFFTSQFPSSLRHRLGQHTNSFGILRAGLSYKWSKIYVITTTFNFLTLTILIFCNIIFSLVKGNLAHLALLTVHLVNENTRQDINRKRPRSRLVTCHGLTPLLVNLIDRPCKPLL